MTTIAAYHSPEKNTAAGDIAVDDLSNILHNPAGNALWVSDGTPAGTHLVKDINPGPGNSNPSTMANAIFEQRNAGRVETGNEGCSARAKG